MSARRHGSRRTGTVVSFDAAAGYGTVGTGAESWFFHCTALADGTRTVAEGASVSFGVTSGHRGRWEATDIRDD